MKSFVDAVKERPGRSLGCRRCGGPRNAGIVTVGVRRLNEKGQLNGAGQRVTTRTRSLCESCCVEVFEELAATLERQTDGRAA